MSGDGTVAVRWSQSHVHYPAAGPGLADVLAGWVDVQLLDGGDAALGFNWAVTFEGDTAAAIDRFDDFYDADRDDSRDPFATLDIDAGHRLTVPRTDPWSVWVDFDHDVHLVTVDQATFDVLREHGTVDRPHEAGHGSATLAFTVPRGKLLPAAALEVLSAASEVTDAAGAAAAHQVTGAWSTDLASRALAVWARALTGLEVAFVYVAPSDEVPAPPMLAEVARRVASSDTAAQHAAEQIAAGNTGPGGYPADLPWVNYASCGWKSLPDDALIGERPDVCMWPATVVGIDDGSARQPKLGIDDVAGEGRRPTGAPVCEDHAGDLAAHGYTLLRSPGRD